MKINNKSISYAGTICPYVKIKKIQSYPTWIQLKLLVKDGEDNE